MTEIEIQEKKELIVRIKSDEYEEERSVFTDALGKRWIRRGACSMCGDCCRDPANIDNDPFGGMKGQPIGAGWCPLFRWAADGIGACTDRGNWYYLAGCRHWPAKPDHIREMKNCTYWFEEGTE